MTRPHLPAPRRSDAWTYDSAYRLTVHQRDIPQGGGIPGEERAWTLDGAQNWASLSISVNGGVPTVLNQTMNDLESYTSFGKAPQVDDLNGNRVDDGEFLYRWDFLNRLREVYRKKSKALITTCAYDALGAQGHLNGSGRRVRKAVTNSGVQDEDVRFLWDGRTLIQEQDAVSGMLIRQQVQAGLGAPLEQDRDTNGDGILDQALFRQENAMGWAEALADVSGVVLERYSYDAYGAPTFLDAMGNPLPDQTRSALGNNLLWGGGYRDNVTRTVSLGHRTFSERQGRFLSRDPLGLWGDVVGWGNGYAYVGNQGVMGWDPEGLGWRDTFSMFWDWVSGTGSPVRVFGPGSDQVREMQSSPGIAQAKALFGQANRSEPADPQATFKPTGMFYEFGLSGLLRAGGNATRQFVGGYDVSVIPVSLGEPVNPDVDKYGRKVTVQINVLNNTTLYSFLYHKTGSMGRYGRDRLKYGGRMTQVYAWTEEIYVDAQGNVRAASEVAALKELDARTETAMQDAIPTWTADMPPPDCP